MGFLHQKTVVSRIFGFPLSTSFLAHLPIVKLDYTRLDETRSPRQKEQQIESFSCVDLAPVTGICRPWPLSGPPSFD
jgi:hypothetical protein